MDLQTSSYCKKSKRISLATKINIWSSRYIEIKFQEGRKAVCALCVCVYLHEFPNSSEESRSSIAQAATVNNVLHMSLICFVNTSVIGI